jgi:hypothetical protein
MCGIATDAEQSTITTATAAVAAAAEELEFMHDPTTAADVCCTRHCRCMATRSIIKKCDMLAKQQQQQQQQHHHVLTIQSAG